MKPIFYLVSDTHFSANPDDEYRMGLFSKLVEYHHNDESRPSTIIFMGDFVDKKDYHPVKFVNNLVDKLVYLQKKSKCKIYLLRGNHDGIDPQSPALLFVNNIPNFTYICDISHEVIDGAKVIFVPHQSQPPAIKANPDTIALLHQTFTGAVSENGQHMNGMDTKIFDGFKAAYSGDIHVPQKVGNIVYVGAPYSIKYGDKYSPRILKVFEDGTYEPIDTSTWFPRKVILHMDIEKDIAESLDFAVESRDHARVVCKVKTIDNTEWESWERNLREECSNRKVVVESVSFEIPNELPQKATQSEWKSNNPKDIIDEYLSRYHPEMKDQYMDVAIHIVEGE